MRCSWRVLVVVMDLTVKDSDGHQVDDAEDVIDIYSVEDEVVADDDDYGGDVDGDETKSLLSAGENGMLRSFDKGARKVQWNDSIGNNLTEVLEFMPSCSESSENGDEDSNNCLCIVM